MIHAIDFIEKTLVAIVAATIGYFVCAVLAAGFLAALSVSV